jgi:protein TonB
MFEDALWESTHRIRTRSKYWSGVAIVINVGAVMALFLWPLLHPQALPTQIMASLLVAPAPPVTPQTPPAARVQIRSRSRSLASEIELPDRIRHGTTIITNSGELQTAVASMTGAQEISDSGDSLNKLVGEMGGGRSAVQLAPPARRPVVSSRLMAGNLIEKTVPQYPVIAREARIQGTVVLQATIGKAGEIQNLRVISGPPMLYQSALDAVRSWRYKPFYLNGEPVAVETTVNVVFSLGN